MTIAIDVTALVASGIAVYTDLQWRRVPNWLTLPLLLLAFVFAAPSGWIALGSVALAAFLFFVLGLFVHRLGWLGGGDLKLLIGLGALFAFPNCIELLLYTGIAGGIMAAIVAVAGGRGGLLITQMRSTIVGALAMGGRVAPVAEASSDRHFPYALAIAAGTVVTLLSLTYFPLLRLPL